MKVLDLFSGTGSATKAFADRGHDVVGLDNNPDFDPDICMSIRTFSRDPAGVLDNKIAVGWRPDVVWASPPCVAFSVGGKGSKAQWDRYVSGEPLEKDDDPSDFRWHYGGDYDFYGPRLPNDTTARKGCAYVLAALHSIRVLDPSYWWMENPMGGLKTMAFMGLLPGDVIITYCQYGENRMKPTSLWGVWPETFRPRPKCKNGDPCHESAPRGARTGTQGLGKVERSMIPYELSKDIAVACETAVQDQEL